MSSEICKKLIERAAAECGSKKTLAERMGVLPHRISEWQSGARELPAEQAAILADIAGLPAEEWLVRQTLANSEGKPYHQRLRDALGKCAPWTGGATGTYSLGVGLGALAVGSQWAGYFPQCIFRLNRKRTSDRKYFRLSQ